MSENEAAQISSHHTATRRSRENEAGEPNAADTKSATQENIVDHHQQQQGQQPSTSSVIEVKEEEKQKQHDVQPQASKDPAKQALPFVNKYNTEERRARSAPFRPYEDPALPPTPFSHRPLLVLDLDETFVSTRKDNWCRCKCDLHFELNGRPHCVFLRPGAKELVAKVAEHFEVVVFTAASEAYGKKVCDHLDPDGTLIHHRRYGQHCSSGDRVKDLSLLGRPLERIAILDNSPKAYRFQPENAIPICDFHYNNPNDDELGKLLPMLIDRLAKADHVYDILEEHRANIPTKKNYYDEY